jgi:hypothetical protein
MARFKAPMAATNGLEAAIVYLLKLSLASVKAVIYRITSR